MAMARRVDVEAARSEAADQKEVVGEEAELATAAVTAVATAASLGEGAKRAERAITTGAVKDSTKMRARMCQICFVCHPFRWRTR